MQMSVVILPGSHSRGSGFFFPYFFAVRALLGKSARIILERFG